MARKSRKDSTRQKASGESPDRCGRFERVLSQISSMYMSLESSEIDRKINEGLRLIGEFMGVDRCFIDQFSNDKARFQLTHMWFADGIPRDDSAFDVVVSERVPWFTKTILSGDSIIIEDLDELPEEAVNEKRYCRDAGLKSFAIVPLRVGKSVIGDFGFDMIRFKRSWLDSDIRRLCLLSEIFANALERKNIADKLLENEQRLRSFMNHSPALMYIKDKSGRHIFGNKAILNFAGMKLQEFIGTTAHNFLPEDVAKRIESYDREVIKSELPIETDEFSIIRNEKLRHFKEIKFPLKLHSGEEGVGGVVMEITSLKKKEKDLQKAYDEIERLKDRLQAENIYLREQVLLQNDYHKMIGRSDAFKYVLFKIEQVASIDTTVLLLGETGTGKALAAKAIHVASLRKDHAFITVDCAALPANLIESELFGREKGAFTGAHASQIGRFEAADGGTIFLDEIGELPLELQGKLLRVIQDGEFERLGSPNTVRVNVRIIASTNRDLKEEVRKGSFREDLFYRLHVFPITLPPLRDRDGDVPLLVSHFVPFFSRKFGKKLEKVPNEIMNALQKHTWPGNVRELMHTIERAVIMTNGSSLQLVDQLEPALEKKDHPHSMGLHEMERNHILQVLKECKGRIEGKRGAAANLGLKPSTLRSRLQKLGIKRPKEWN